MSINLSKAAQFAHVTYMCQVSVPSQEYSQGLVNIKVLVVDVTVNVTKDQGCIDLALLYLNSYRATR